MAETEKIPLLGMSLPQLQALAVEQGLPKYAGAQIAQWLYAKRADSIEQMSNLSKDARRRLSEKYCVGRMEPKARAKSKDGTVKYLFPGVGGRDIEAVYIPDRDRATLCVSSQAGCKMQCDFCMTGRQGFHGNLSVRDIINQVMSVDDSESLTNIVFMGMGEPLDNLSAVLQAIDVLTAPWGFGWSPKRITVSTIGKIKELKELIEQTKVHIAISVHNPNGRERAQIMPVERAYPIAEVLSLLRGYDFAHQRRLSIEYIMWRGENDTMRYAEHLARLLQGSNARVNLIRYHVLPGESRQPSSPQVMEAFRDKLNELGITATIRASRGEDIEAACGMLSGKKEKSND